MLSLDSSPAVLKEVERNLKIHDDILRNVSVKVEAFQDGPSFMMNNRGDYQEGRYSAANTNDEE
jgi:small subunit ribosomal protein S6